MFGNFVGSWLYRQRCGFLEGPRSVLSCWLTRRHSVKSKVSVGTHVISTALVRNSISTKYGDGGETSLLYGGRVAKTNRRVHANGIGDETVSALGLARASCESDFLHDELLEIQRLMFLANAEITTEIDQLGKLQKHFQTIDAEHVAKLDGLLERLEDEVKLPRAFVIPGASVSSAALDMARCKIRNLEREAVSLFEDGMIQNEHLLSWLNRLSDCIFMMARYVDRDLPTELLTGTRRSR